MRPTLLDTVGLFEALKWLLKGACTDKRVEHSVTLPAQELHSSGPLLHQAFRATQTVLDCTFAEPDLEKIELEAFVIAETLAIRIAHRHIQREPAGVLERYQLELASACHRIESLRGENAFDASEIGAAYTIHIPLRPIES